MTVEVPGSKSLTNRYLVLAALSEGPGVLRGALRSRDTLLMGTALRGLGVDLGLLRLLAAHRCQFRHPGTLPGCMSGIAPDQKLFSWY